jgi:hypothetical protein
MFVTASIATQRADLVPQNTRSSLFYFLRGIGRGETYLRKNRSPLFSVGWFCGKFLALEARMTVAGGKPEELRRTHRIGERCLRALMGCMN